MTVDLHLHSLVSDGVAIPEDVVRRAAAVGLRILAIADHDDVAGTAAAQAAGREHGAVVIPAIELTASVGGKGEGTVHILGYGIDPASAALGAVARKNREGKRQQALAIVARLRALGIDLAPEEVGLDRPGDAYIGRNRIAAALVSRGLAKDRLKAFKKWLEPGARAWVPPEVVPAADAVSAIRVAGGIAVLAHPTEHDLAKHLGQLCDLGVEGLELYRPRAQGTLLERTQRAAEKRDLLVTGGSDWHGLYRGVPLGDWKVRPEQIARFLERLGVPVT